MVMVFLWMGFWDGELLDRYINILFIYPFLTYSPFTKYFYCEKNTQCSVNGQGEILFSRPSFFTVYVQNTLFSKNRAEFLPWCRESAVLFKYYFLSSPPFAKRHAFCKQNTRWSVCGQVEMQFWSPSLSTAYAQNSLYFVNRIWYCEFLPGSEKAL